MSARTYAARYLKLTARSFYYIYQTISRKTSDRRLLYILTLGALVYILIQHSCHPPLPLPLTLDALSIYLPYTFPSYVPSPPKPGSEGTPPLDVTNPTQVREVFNSFFPERNPGLIASHPWMARNRRKMEVLVECLRKGDCARNQDSGKLIFGTC